MAILPLDNELMLFRQIADGNEQAFRLVYLHYYKKLYGVIFHTTKSAHITDEILQETFSRLWEHRYTLAEKEYNGSWLFRVAANLAYDYLRKAAYEKKLYTLLLENQATSSTDNVTRHMEQYDSTGLLHEAVSRLPEQRQLIFRLSRMQGLNHQEIADQLALSPHTVRNQLVKALKSVRFFIARATHLFFF